MPKNLDATIIDELAGLSMFPFFTLDLTDGTNEYKYSTLDIPIHLTASGTTTISGTYLPKGFIFESINSTLSNVMDDATIRIDDLDDVLKSVFVGGSIKGKAASVHIGLIDSNEDVIGTVLLFTGEVDSFTLDESELRLVIGSVFTKWSHQTYNKHSSSCRWKVFKGVECAYGGAETWCDRSYTRCGVLANTANFGGFRWLPSIENKKFQWGPNQTEATYLAKR